MSNPIGEETFLDKIKAKRVYADRQSSGSSDSSQGDTSLKSSAKPYTGVSVKSFVDRFSRTGMDTGNSFKSMKADTGIDSEEENDKVPAYIDVNSIQNAANPDKNWANQSLDSTFNQSFAPTTSLPCDIMFIDDNGIIKRFDSFDEISEYLVNASVIGRDVRISAERLKKITRVPLRIVDHFITIGMYLKRLYENDFLMDVSIEVMGQKFYAHRIALSCHSEYFAELFRKSNGRKLPFEVRINGISAGAFATFLEFCYTGELNLYPEIASEILIVADYLKVRGLKAKCDVIVKNLPVDEAVKTIVKSNLKPCRMYNSLYDSILTNFSKASKNENFLSLDVDTFCRMIQSDDLVISSEYELFTIVVRWIIHDVQARVKHTVKVMSHVRFAHMSQNELFLCAETTSLVRGYDKFREMILIANWIISTEQEGRIDSFNFPRTKPRKCFQNKEQNGDVTDPSLMMPLPVMTSTPKTLRSFSPADSLLSEQPASLASPYSASTPVTTSAPMTTHVPLMQPPLFRGASNPIGAPMVRPPMSMGSSNPTSTPMMRPPTSNPTSAPMMRPPTSNPTCASMVRTPMSMGSSNPTSTPMMRPPTSMGPSNFASAPMMSPPSSMPSSGQTQSHMSSSSNPEPSPSPVDEPILASSMKSEASPVDPHKHASFVDILVVGGFIAKPKELAATNVDKYDIEDNQWLHFCGLPSPRRHHAVVAIDNALYMIGGSEPCDKNSVPVPVNTVFKMDLTTKEWSTVAPMNAHRHSHGACVVDGIIYAIGGKGKFKSVLASVESYDPRKNVWEFAPSMPESVFAASVESLGNRIFVAGGLSTNDKMPSATRVLPSLYCYDTIEKSWTTLNNLRFPRCHASLVNVNDRLFLCGGATTKIGVQSAGLSSTSNIDEYNTDKDEWVHVTDMVVPRHDCGVAVTGSRIYIIGGVTMPSDRVLQSIECYDTITSAWVPGVQELPYPARWICCCSVPSRYNKPHSPLL